jgi:hypothetical protein
VSGDDVSIPGHDPNAVDRSVADQSELARIEAERRTADRL